HPHRVRKVHQPLQLLEQTLGGIKRVSDGLEVVLKLFQAAGPLGQEDGGTSGGGRTAEEAGVVHRIGGDVEEACPVQYLDGQFGFFDQPRQFGGPPLNLQRSAIEVRLRRRERIGGVVVAPFGHRRRQFFGILPSQQRPALGRRRQLGVLGRVGQVRVERRQR